VNFIKTVEKVKEVMKEEIISGNDTQPYYRKTINSLKKVKKGVLWLFT
jgi:hypothetical protein